MAAQSPHTSPVILVFQEQPPVIAEFQSRILTCLHLNQLSELAESIAQALHLTAPNPLYQAKELNSLLNSSMDAILIVNQDLRIERLNAAGENMFLRQEHEVLGQSLNCLIPPRFHSRHMEHVKNFIKAGLNNRRMGTAEHIWGLRSNGEEFPVEISILKFELGNQLFLGAILRDVSLRLEQEQKLKTQAELMNLLSDAMIVGDQALQINFWNRGAERLYGYSREEAMGRSLFELLKPADQNGLSPHLTTHLHDFYQQLIEKGCLFTESLHQTKNGEKRRVKSHYTLLKNSADDLQPRILSVHTDITVQKEKEERALRAQHMEGIGNLAAAISHDMINLLAPVLLTSELLEQGEHLSAAEHERLNLIQDCTRQSLEIIQQILTFSRRTHTQKQELNPQELLNQMLRIIQHTFPAHILIQTEIPKEAWFIYAEAGQIQQALLNLCINARDATPGGGLLSIGIENTFLNPDSPEKPATLPAGPFVLFTVRDTGTGLPKEDQTRIFEPFFTTKRVGQGSGLGLTSCQQIIQAHQGFIVLSSELGQGSCFHVYLPALLDTHTIETETPTIDFTSLRGAGEYILIVEQPPLLAKAIQNSLEDYEYRVMIADHALSAITQAAQLSDRLLTSLISLELPDMKGILLGKILQQMQKTEPLIYMYTPSQLQSLQELETPEPLLLAKPFQVDTLLKLLFRLRHSSN